MGFLRPCGHRVTGVHHDILLPENDSFGQEGAPADGGGPLRLQPQLQDAAVALLCTSESNRMSTHPDKVREFLDAFEEVFDRDWTYTKQMLGVRGGTEEQKQACAKAGLETIPIIADDGTFVHPKLEDEIEDWGNRARLLVAYRALRKEMP